MSKPAQDNQTNFNIAGRVKPLSRRTMLKGLGVAMALPMLDAMGTTQALAAAGTTKTPTRMAFVFAPNGVNYDHWLPKGNGKRYELSPTLKPLEGVRKHVNIMTGLTLDKARANGDGPGDHARSSATFLTGAQARKTSGNDIRIGVSVDQFAAQQVGDQTRLPSLEIGLERGRSAGRCDSGYSCAYVSNVSWADEDSPVPKMTNAMDVFERLFGKTDFDNLEAEAAKQERLRRRASILDYVMQDSQRLERKLGKADRNKIDEFQTSIREIERRVQMAKSSDDIVVPDVDPPTEEPTKLSERIDLMYDMMRLAFQMDVTRISTFMLGNGGSNKRFDELDILDGHHTLSHHRNNAEMVEKIRKIDHYYAQGFARFVKKMADTPDGEGTLLDHSMILFGSGICDGNRHNHENLPIVMAGTANGSIETGRLLNYRKETPLCNLYMSMLDRMGADVAEFGDATGRLEGLTG